MPLNRELLGRVYESQTGFEVSAEAIRAYALATNSTNTRYLGQGAVVAPPCFCVAVSREVLARALLDPDLHVDLPRLLHTDQVMRFHQPLRPGDRLRARTTVSFFDDKRTGECMDLQSQIHRENGALVYESVVGIFIRYEERKASDALLPPIGTPRSELPRVPAGAETLVEASVEVAADQSVRYAAASGDDNPIHLDETFARSVGLPGIILHGLCTLAMAQHAIVDGVAGGDPTVLRALSCKFTRPVLMGDTLTTRGQRLDEGDGVLRLGFEVLNQAGKAVIKDGVAEIARG
ncbi:MAG: MaoC/PaaZ C-terminal domain-containing protein [Pseudomonadota bacterium]